nr:phosphatase PAP2 family protein [Nocardia bovistercoris]
MVLLPTAVAVASIGIPCIKQAFGVARPPLEMRMAVVGDASYPSGHVTGTTAVAVLVMLLSSGWRTSCARRAYATVITVAVVASVGGSRLYLGLHWLTDIVGGALFGGSIAMTVGAAAALTDAHSSAILSSHSAAGMHR